MDDFLEYYEDEATITKIKQKALELEKKFNLEYGFVRQYCLFKNIKNQFDSLSVKIN